MRKAEIGCLRRVQMPAQARAFCATFLAQYPFSQSRLVLHIVNQIQYC